MTPTSVFCGYTEQEPLLSAGYVHSSFDTHPDFANSPDLRKVVVMFGVAGLRETGSPRRLDYILARGVKVRGYELVGGELISKEKWRRDGSRGTEIGSGGIPERPFRRARRRWTGVIAAVVRVLYTLVRR